jgi:glycosyltransferase involved in cell wall biosynthesis
MGKSWSLSPAQRIPKGLVVSNVTAIVLTYNEAQNIGQCLSSVGKWAHQTIVLDSYSTDETCTIARSYGCEVFYNRFEGYAEQRSYALTSLPIKTEWILFLDADEWLTPALKVEIDEILAKEPRVDGFYLKRRLMWMGRWIRRGYYPVWILRLFRKYKASCPHRSVNEHIVVEGEIAYLQNDIIHEDHKGIGDWIAKHNKYAELEAQELVRQKTLTVGAQGENLFGTQVQRTFWLRRHVWQYLPPLVRPFLYFSYRYFLRGGIFDGRAALVYHFMQALWFPMLVDLKYLEMKRTHRLSASISLSSSHK